MAVSADKWLEFLTLQLPYWANTCKPIHPAVAHEVIWDMPFAGWDRSRQRRSALRSSELQVLYKGESSLTLRSRQLLCSRPILQTIPLRDNYSLTNKGMLPLFFEE